jgi:putative thioredoxin
MSTLVVVDLWAEWCGPCKQLSPILERLAEADAGSWVLAKVDVDANPGVTGAFQVQSIPTVYAMFQGQPVADLTNARSESQLKGILDQLLAKLPVQPGGAAPAQDVGPLIAMGEDALAGGDAERAASIFMQIAEIAPDNGAAQGGLLRALIAAGHIAEAEAILAELPETLAKDADIARARAALDLAKDRPEDDELAALRAAATPDNPEGQLAYATAAFAAGVVVLRDGLSPRDTVGVLVQGMRTTVLAETLLGWLMAVAWITVGWWTPALCTVIVLALWRTARTEALLDHDDLTGVLTARAFALRVAAAADRARRGIEGGAYLFLDLDGFKAVNDGPRNHLVGDQVLAELGRRLRRVVRVTDAVGRRGGDEFTVLFTGVQDAATALRLAERIAEVVTEPYHTADGEHRIGVSIGVAMLTPGRRDFEPDVRQHADAAMYEAKHTGGGIRIWTGEDDPAAVI